MQGFFFAKPMKAADVLELATGPRRADWKFIERPAVEALSQVG